MTWSRRPAVRPGRPGLGEHLPVGDVLAGMLAPPPRDHVGDVRDAHAEDERQASGLDLFLVRLAHHTRVRDDVTSGRSCAAINSRMTGSMVLVSALFPSKALTISGNPAVSVSRPMVICGSSRRSLENPLSRNPSPLSVSQYKVLTS